MAKRQTQIPGTERVTIEEIDEAAEELRVLRDERMAVANKERTAHAKLLDTMRKHNQTIYQYEDNEGASRKVTIVEGKIKVSIKKLKVVDDDGFEEEDGPDDESADVS